METLLKHQESIRHVEATTKRQECKRILTKGNIYKQMYEGQRVQIVTIKAQTRCAITKFFKTIDGLWEKTYKMILVMQISECASKIAALVPHTPQQLQ